MNSKESIQAAIEKLTRLQELSTGGNWFVASDEGDGQSNICPRGEGVILWGEYADSRDTNLVATLHATVEAQISLLQDALNYRNRLDRDGVEFTDVHDAPIHALARAILGN